MIKLATITLYFMKYIYPVLYNANKACDELKSRWSWGSGEKR
jgi:hypothetical protein